MDPRVAPRDSDYVTVVSACVYYFERRLSEQDGDVSRPKHHDFPLYMTVDERGGYYVRNPLTGKKKRFSDETMAREAAKLLAEWVDIERQARPTANRRVRSQAS